MCCTLITHAANYKFVALDNSKETKICIAAVKDNIKNLKKEAVGFPLATTYLMSNSSFRMKFIANKLKCNNTNIADFARKYNALYTFNYLNDFANKWNKALPTSGTIKDIAEQDSKSQNEKEILILVASR